MVYGCKGLHTVSPAEKTKIVWPFILGSDPNRSNSKNAKQPWCYNDLQQKHDHCRAHKITIQIT